MRRRADLSLTDRQWGHLRRWWAAQLPLPCARCTAVIQPGEPFNLDHLVALADGGTAATARPSHPSCDARAGQLIAQRQRVRIKGPLIADAVPTLSRAW